MVKDEDVCLHCGLCAERCPTGAWDMQKFLLDMTHAAGRRTLRMNASAAQNAASTTSSSSSPTSTARARRAPTGCSPRSILRMGVPVASRNIFPSNIQGLPTWYEVRVSEAGHLGRRGGVDLMVAMNPQTWDKDVAEIEPGGYLFYDSTRPLPPSKFRDDITVIGMPLTAICNARYTDPRQRQLFKNIIYVGALAELLGIELAEVEKLIGEQFKGKDKLIPPNIEALQHGPRLRPRRARPRSASRSGAPTRSATASSSRATTPPALGAVYGGATVAPGTRSRPRPRWPRPSRKHCRALPRRSGRPARTATPSSRPRTSSPRSAW